MKVTFASLENNSNWYCYNAAKDIFKPFMRLNEMRKDSYTRRSSVLEKALNNLEQLTFSNDDVIKVQRYGARLIFAKGKDALDFAKNNNINIVFAHVDRPDIHAQWINSKNTVVINEKYKNSTNNAELYAISAAVLHELSHAKDGDEKSSIQEEIDCLAMNALAFNYFKKLNPEVFKNVNSPILQDGVALYTDLFLGNDKNSLIQRIRAKYGDLALESPNHKASEFAKNIKI